VRLVVVSALIAVIATAPALGCPRRVLCVVDGEAAPRHEVARFARFVHVRDVRPIVRRPDKREHVYAHERVRSANDEPELPWIWRALRDHVYARLPRYHDAKRFTLVVSPVVVTSPSDTVPGIGLAGNF
jgi:hypothetical protein